MNNRINYYYLILEIDESQSMEESPLFIFLFDYHHLNVIHFNNIYNETLIRIDSGYYSDAFVATHLIPSKQCVAVLYRVCVILKIKFSL